MIALTPEKVLELVAKPGCEFHVHRMLVHMDCTPKELFPIICKLEDQGRVEFTGRLCIWRRKN